MSANPSVEERLTALEKQVAELQQQVAELRNRLPLADSKADWLEQISGSMAGFPEFDEVLRLGREIRNADRPPEEPLEQP
jgi:hypothetical protein